MSLNRLLTSTGAALLLAVGLAAPASAVTIDPIDPIGLGFGEFLGTWVNEPPSDSGMPNPSDNNVEEVGLAILAKYPGSFPIAEFNLAGAIDSYGGAHTNFNGDGTGFRIESDANGTYARWDYYGFPPGPAIPDVTPGMEPTELYVAVKYGIYTSVFLYDVVNPGEFGYISSDFQIILDNASPAEEAALNYDGFDGFNGEVAAPCTWGHTTGGGRPVYTPEFSDTCMGEVHGISHVVGYWPPVDGDTSVPEPMTLSLLGAGLIGVAAMRRKRAA